MFLNRSAAVRNRLGLLCSDMVARASVLWKEKTQSFTQMVSALSVHVIGI